MNNNQQQKYNILKESLKKEKKELEFFYFEKKKILLKIKTISVKLQNFDIMLLLYKIETLEKKLLDYNQQLIDIIPKIKYILNRIETKERKIKNIKNQVINLTSSEYFLLTGYSNNLSFVYPFLFNLLENWVLKGWLKHFNITFKFSKNKTIKLLKSPHVHKNAFSSFSNEIIDVQISVHYGSLLKRREQLFNLISSLLSENILICSSADPYFKKESL